MNPPIDRTGTMHQVGLSDVLRVQRHTPLRVLISEPQLISYGLPYLPVMWGILKTYWEHHGSRPELVEWHEPIHEMRDPDAIASSLRDQPIDIIGLSCYTWNWRLQQQVASRLRESHPDALIVAGGPHPDYRDPTFFEKNPALDAVVVKDGEIPFTRIIERALAFDSLRAFRDAGLPMQDIAGLCLPNLNGQLTAPSELPVRYDISHYLEQRTYYEKFFREHKGGVCVAWETSRGCPFKCSYCDWGSSTMSKVRRFDMKRLREEIDWFGRNGAVSLFSVDSNFGMFKTDVDLTDRIVETKLKHGYPQYFVYSNAKNVPDRTVEITRKVVNAGLDTAHTLSIQHSNEDVLAATDRKNISIEKQIKVVRDLQGDGIPISVQLILGLPRDNPQLWRRTFTDLMEWGIHDGYIITNYHLLPNAPAAQPEYRSRWGLQTIDRFIYDGNGIQENIPVDPLTYARGEVIVESSSFSREDWVTMSTEAALIRGLHNPGVTQGIARFLRYAFDISYESLYALIIDELFSKQHELRKLKNQIESCFSTFLSHPDSLSLLPMPGRNDDRFLVEPHRWLFASICASSSAFYDALAECIVTRFGHEEIVRSMCAYQHAMLVRPTYDKHIGIRHSSSYDWASYFASLDSSENPHRLPARLPVWIQATDSGWDDGAGSAEYNWPVGDHQESWTSWFRCIAYGRLSAMKGNLQKLETQARDIEHEQSGRRIGA